MDDESVALAATRYERGASLAFVAKEFGLRQRTLARELRLVVGLCSRLRHRGVLIVFGEPRDLADLGPQGRTTADRVARGLAEHQVEVGAARAERGIPG